MPQNAELVLHPATPGGAVSGIAVAIERTSAEMRLSYRLEGDIARLRLPEPAEAMRTDSLWQHTCFEVFLRPDGGERYYEFNFAPSSAWAVYGFAARRGDRELPELAAPAITSRRNEGTFEMMVRLPLDGLPELAQAASIDAGISAVVEDARGMMTYWALAHASREPDFHDPATFRLRIGRQ
jgi:hypothetical protein